MIISYDWVRDYRLSPYTVGVMARLLSNTSRFLIDVRQLAQQWRQPVRAIRRALSELVKFGYAVYEQQRAADGTLAQVTMSIGDPAALHTVQPGADQAQQDETAGGTALHVPQPGSISLEEQLTEDQVLDAADASPHLGVISGGNQMNEPTLFDQQPAPAPQNTPKQQSTTAAIVGEWLQRCRSRPPQRIIGQVSRLVKEMIDEGIAADDVRRGCAQWMSRGQHPATLPSFVNQVMNTRPELAVTAPPGLVEYNGMMIKARTAANLSLIEQARLIDQQNARPALEATG